MGTQQRSSDVLRARALELYAEAREIQASGIWRDSVLRAYRAKYAEAHAVDMAHLDACAEEMRAAAREQTIKGGM